MTCLFGACLLYRLLAVCSLSWYRQEHWLVTVAVFLLQSLEQPCLACIAILTKFACNGLLRESPAICHVFSKNKNEKKIYIPAKDERLRALTYYVRRSIRSTHIYSLMGYLHFSLCTHRCDRSHHSKRSLKCSSSAV